MDKWKHISQVRAEGLEYMRARKDGVIKSVASPWPKFNDASIAGLEWGSINVFGGRPGSGKTLMANQFTRSAFALNPGQQFAVLDLQFEMAARTTAVRELSSVMKKTYKQLLSADGVLSESDFLTAQYYAQSNSNQPIFQVETPLSGVGIHNRVSEFMDYINLPTIVTLDHSILVKKDGSQKDKFEVLYDLGETLTELKKSRPVIFIVITQMNRSIEEQQRRTPGTIANFPTTADVWGADALLQHCDMMTVINKPFLYGIPYYGPEQFVVTPNLLAMHFLKCRNGEQSIAFFDADFPNMSINNMGTPLTKSGPMPKFSALSTHGINP